MFLRLFDESFNCILPSLSLVIFVPPKLIVFPAKNISLHLLVSEPMSNNKDPEGNKEPLIVWVPLK